MTGRRGERQTLQDDIANLPESSKDIDVLVNNAGVALGLGSAHQADLDQWEQMVDTNIKGLMYCTRYILPGMIERNRGHIINIGSVAGNWPYPIRAAMFTAPPRPEAVLYRA